MGERRGEEDGEKRKVRRGGGWNSSASDMDIEYREGGQAGRSDEHTGVRFVRTIRRGTLKMKN